MVLPAYPGVRRSFVEILNRIGSVVSISSSRSTSGVIAVCVASNRLADGARAQRLPRRYVLSGALEGRRPEIAIVQQATCYASCCRRDDDGVRNLGFGDIVSLNFGTRFRLVLAQENRGDEQQSLPATTKSVYTSGGSIG
jgi:hypothetical protein